MENVDKYFLVPISFIRDLVVDKDKVLNQIIDYGLYKFAMSMELDTGDGEHDLEAYQTGKQIIYCYYRKRELLPKSILIKLEKYIKNETICLDEDTYGFHGYNFSPDTEMIGMMDVMKIDKNFRDEVCEFGRMKITYDLMEINGNIGQTLQEMKKLEKSIKKSEPMVMVKRDLAFEYRDSEKTEFELMTFAVNLGIRSILGKKPYCRTTKQLIFSRAFGFRNFEELQQNKPELFDKYSNRWQSTKLLNEVETGNWNISIYSSNTMRGLYVAKKRKITYENLITMAESKRRKTKTEALRKKKKEIAERVIRSLNEQQPNDTPTTS